jgi:hypothetical protein
MSGEAKPPNSTGKSVVHPYKDWIGRWRAVYGKRRRRLEAAATIGVLVLLALLARFLPVFILVCISFPFLLRSWWRRRRFLQDLSRKGRVLSADQVLNSERKVKEMQFCALGSRLYVWVLFEGSPRTKTPAARWNNPCPFGGEEFSEWFFIHPCNDIPKLAETVIEHGGVAQEQLIRT